jgi:uncharacterized protein with HEPN domain
MSRDIDLYFEDIEMSCKKVLLFTDGLTYEQFKKNDLVYDAVLRNLEIIGEASKHVPENMQKNTIKLSGERSLSFVTLLLTNILG